MKVNGENTSRTLADKLGETPHVSPLLKKICLASGCPETRIQDWLLKAAIIRGATHYERAFARHLPGDSPQVSDEELGVALCLGQNVYDAVLLRAAAQFLSSAAVSGSKLKRLAIMERVEPVLLFIAQIAGRFAPGLEPWRYLREHLHVRRQVRLNNLPHWSRFVSQTGVTGFGGGPQIDWLQRRGKQNTKLRL
ncbi:MAG TPA: hypothetical protein VGE41_04790 [Verrucomicrobiae bacterium]